MRQLRRADSLSLFISALRQFLAQYILSALHPMIKSRHRFLCQTGSLFHPACIGIMGGNVC